MNNTTFGGQPLVNPATTQRLDVLAPPPPKQAPHQCCADFAAVKFCENDIDTWECWVCGATWEAPCR